MANQGLQKMAIHNTNYKIEKTTQSQIFYAQKQAKSQLVIDIAVIIPTTDN